MNLVNETIVLDHGTGAKLSSDLVASIVDVLGEAYIGTMEDSAVLPVTGERIAITTDSFVVTPIFFGNGDIGKIAVCGTVNDLAVSGARPLYLTLSMVLEVGFPIADLLRIAASIRDAALEAGIKIVAGDTKIVREGEVDKVFLNTAGVGVFERPPLSHRGIEPGDRIVVSGYLGNHSIHLLSVREGLGFERRVQSDCAPLNAMIDELLRELPSGKIKAIRDVTRGGLAAVLHEYAKATGRRIEFDERELPILPETAMAASMLGVNPLHLANEGCLCIFVAPDAEARLLELLRRHRYGAAARSVGRVSAVRSTDVAMTQHDGTEKNLEELLGAELPRLC